MKTWIIGALIVVVVLIGAIMVVKKVSPLSLGWWGTTNASSGVAIKGYDAVAYFTADEPMEGNAEHTYEWNDATWHFASTENRDLFAANPASYAPQFGGFCSFAVSKGFTADISPDAWHVVDDKLYVFADQNVRDDWVAGLGDGSLAKSEANWAKR